MRMLQSRHGVPAPNQHFPQGTIIMLPASGSAQNPAPQAGKLAVITGATGGLGFETALALARAGAHVVLTGRNAAKGAAALERIRAQRPDAAVRYAHLDLASLDSVRQFSAVLVREHATLDILVNNAGVMAPPQCRMTSDGLELQFATNYLGHFALTARLLGPLRAAPRARVVSVSSNAQRFAADFDFAGLGSGTRYNPWKAYAASKLACLMFALELQRRSDRAGWGLTSVAAHPGFARTELFANGPGAGGFVHQLNERLLLPWLSQSATAGAQPLIFAAAAAEAEAGHYYGPTGLLGMKGPVGPATLGRRARDPEAAARLWNRSEELAGLRWPVH